eukprot:COSAG05_NODE_1437_length_4887_cov_5.343150_2_plen_346_part_00
MYGCAHHSFRGLCCLGCGGRDDATLEARIAYTAAVPLLLLPPPMFLAVLSALAAPAAAARIANDTLLVHVPMVMTHDSASGYLGGGLVNHWTKTQSVGIAQQLDCGARAFDARPMNSKGGLHWHHGGVAIPYAVAQTLADVTSWAAKNPGELAMLLFSDCEGDGCSAALATALKNAGFATVSDCSELETLTYGQALAKGHVAGGGSALAFTGAGGSNGAACANTYYDSSLACSGTHGGKEYSCWVGAPTKSYPVGRMLKMLDAQDKPASDGRFQQWQAIWQESTDSVIIGTIKNSSLVLDEQHSQLNRGILTPQVKAGRWKNVGLLEVNNVCDGGIELAAALKHD